MRRPSSENIDGGGQGGGQGQVTVTAPDWNQHASVREESWGPLARRVSLQHLLQPEVRTLTLRPAQRSGYHLSVTVGPINQVFNVQHSSTNTCCSRSVCRRYSHRLLQVSRHAVNMRREAILCNRAQSLRQQASMNRTDITYPPFSPTFPE